MNERFATPDDVPLDIGRAWLGQELVDRDDWIVTLSSSDLAELEEAARPLDDARRPRLFDRCRLSAPASRASPRRNSDRASRRTRLRAPPRLARRSVRRAHDRGDLHGDRSPSRPRAITERDGTPARKRVRPRLVERRPDVRIYQTSERQTFHTDSCDVVGLLMLREARSGGDSLLVSALAIFAEMRRTRPDLLARLMQPMPHDRRGEIPAGERPYFEMPVFSWHADRLTVFYQRQYFDSAQRFPDARRLTADDVAALDLFDRIANDPRFVLPMRLEPGDIQFVHNHTLLHDRTAFVDHAERRRHLLRLWLACPGARPLPEWFRPRYGSLTIGDRGGIVVAGTKPSVPLAA